MSAPLEFRYYMPKFTLNDLRSGQQPIRLPAGPHGAIELYGQPRLEFRYRERADANGLLRWSAWAAVPVVREGEDLAILASIEPDAEIRPS